MPTINIKTEMKRYTTLEISKTAIDELHKRMLMFFELHMKDLETIAKNHKRKTIFADDITEFYSFKKNNDIGDE